MVWCGAVLQVSPRPRHPLFAVYQALTCNCACEGPTAQALSQAAAKANSGCGGVATALSGGSHVPLL